MAAKNSSRTTRSASSKSLSKTTLPKKPTKTQAKKAKSTRRAKQKEAEVLVESSDGESDCSEIENEAEGEDLSKCSIECQISASESVLNPDLNRSQIASESSTLTSPNIVPPNQSNDYELSDDDSEQDDVEMEEPMYTTTGGISYLHADRWYIPSDEEEDMLESDSGGEQQLDELAGDDDHDDHTTMTDSGSDFHSDEMFSGDEEILRIKFGGPPAQVGNGNGTMI
ncbi:hypothetical protein JR316_0010448 [Psilocybe cubensis]|uniref:Uncharacterized protein n=1 Tax=Psilocybe cubensis TaxID=181762 RepID=A0ACB8GLW9_PSICU|nr:hypothetical protein JR316_0010448 [Psilocybe cubensis]KAH9476536.1 hypothetical protein JR316_0010448 [Psilocybe cubensis]